MLSGLSSVNDVARRGTWIKTTSFVETATALFLFIKNGHWTRAQHPSNRLEADLRQRGAKPSLGWPECQRPTPRDGWLALAAKVRNPPVVLFAANTAFENAAIGLLRRKVRLVRVV